MPAALLGAVSCGLCAHEQPTGDVCNHCGALWVAPRTTPTIGQTGPLAGVVRASTGRRVLAHVIDWGLPLVLAAAVATQALPSILPASLAGSVAAVIVIAQVLALTLLGRSLGRWLLSQRTVDDLRGLPVRPRHLWAQLSQAGRPLRLVTADLRRGRDPVEPQLTGPAGAPLTASLAPAALASASGGAPPAAPATGAGTPRPSVGIVLETGERYEVQQSLLIGRSPVDPVAGGSRQVLAWPDLSRRLAKTHLLLEWSGTELSVTDLNSMTGTTLVTATGERTPLIPGVRTRVLVGSLLVCGGRSIKVVPHG